MAVYRSIVATGIGSAIATIAMGMLLANSVFFTLAADANIVYRWALVFLFGLFVLGWGLGTLVS
ncbi:MAG: hypothetical protein ABEH65_13290 [Halobacteriales archaeon]